MPTLTSKLGTLHESSSAKGRFTIAAAVADLMLSPAAIDRRINLVGAMHEEGLLRNSLAPWWREFRTDERAWAKACLSRLTTIGRDHDYWALAALLGCGAQSVLTEATAVGLQPWSLRWYERFDQPRVHVVCMSPPSIGATHCPHLELGWDSATHELVDCSRARAVLFERTSVIAGESKVGAGSIAYFMRAALPYGVWRIHEDRFELKAEHVLAYSESLLKYTA